ncbi:MAG: peptidoglycan DD-metalloendopeptidase family protein [Candidatus Eisenbacteria bacterium]|nr:peptidoglycan DD-metalloendopeptidase family protein [Candidatus Eisenbacteria bacterium]
MKQSWFAAFAASLFVVLLAGFASAFDGPSATAKGRVMLGHVKAGDATAMWGELSSTMRTAMKDSASFAGMLVSINGSLGALDSVVSEEISEPAPGTWTYVATCRYSKVPVPIAMTFTFDRDGRVAGMFARPAGGAPKEHASSHLEYVTKTALRLPFEGEWFVVWGGRTVAQNYHAATRDQRFALDVLMVKDGSTHKGDGKALTDYWCYGQKALAPGAGTVVWMRDSLPDNAPGQTDAKNAIGNGVVIDHGNGEYSLLGHMQPKSLRVKTGDRVKAGQLLGLVGNSGNTSEPHIHYHLQNGPKPFDADGLPIPFTNLLVDGAPVAKAEVVKGQMVAPGTAKH